MNHWQKQLHKYVKEYNHSIQVYMLNVSVWAVAHKLYFLDHIWSLCFHKMLETSGGAGSWFERPHLTTASCSSNYSLSVSASRWPHLYHHLHLSRDQSGQTFISWGGGHIWLHTGFVFARFYSEYEEAEWPSALQNEVHKTRAARNYCTKTSTKDGALYRDTSFPYTLYCWITQVFPLFWQLPLLAFFQWSLLPCITKQKLETVWKTAAC